MRVREKSCWLLAGGLIAFAFCWGVIGFGADYSEPINKHTEIINSIGRSARTSSEVMDLLMRVGHYTDNHGDTKHILCPECSKNDVRIAEEFLVEDEFPDEPMDYNLPSDESEEVPETFEQVMRDLHEINNGVQAIDFGHMHQIIHLRKLLKELQEDNENKDN